jgi:hypothetical protein
MTRLEDRLRRDLRAQAEHITPLSVPRLRLEQFTNDLQAPAGLTRGAAHRRRRWLALRPAATAAAAVLAAGAVAVVAVVVPGGGTRGRAIDTAYVVKRAESALSATGSGEIAQMTVTSSTGEVPGAPAAAPATAEEWSYGGQWRAVAYSSAGHPVYDEGQDSSSVYTWVDYPIRTWQRQPVTAAGAALVPGSRGCQPVAAALPVLFQPGLPGPGFSASTGSATVARALRAAISCGALTVAGRQRVGGIEAIELTSSPDSPVPETIWISPDTYLPVRVLTRPTAKPGAPWQTADITWLSPTAQNLAKLTVPIPAGFHQLPPGAQLGKPR